MQMTHFCDRKETSIFVQGERSLQKTLTNPIIQCAEAVKNASDQQMSPLRTSSPLPPLQLLPLPLRQKKGRFTTRDLASALAYLFLPSGPFFTLIWGWDNAQGLFAAAANNWFAASAIPLIANFHQRRLLPLPKGKGTAGWPLICPGEPREDLGRGLQSCHRRDVCFHAFQKWAAPATLGKSIKCSYLRRCGGLVVRVLASRSPVLGLILGIKVL